MALGNGEQALLPLGQKGVFDLAGFTGIMKAPGGFAGETVTVLQSTAPQPAGISTNTLL